MCAEKKEVKAEAEATETEVAVAPAAEFLEAITIAKEKLKAKKEEAKKAKKAAKKKEEETKKKLAELAIEKELEKEKLPAKPPVKPKPIPPELVPPIYKRPLPPLPPAPRVTAEWPLRPPGIPARPPEAEAAAPPTAPIPTLFPPEARPEKAAPRPIVVKPAAPVAPAVAPAAPTLDLDKLNPLIADETITAIQCDGANIPLKITKERRVEEITLVLNEEEIKSIIRAFSEASGQAVTEPMFKVSIAGLTISANISAFAGCKFVITRS